jgi:hypothetical protein
MVTHVLIVVLPKTKYFARFVVVVFPVFAALNYGQTTLLNSRAIHEAARWAGSPTCSDCRLNTDLSTGTV